MGRHLRYVLYDQEPDLFACHVALTTPCQPGADEPIAPCQSAVDAQ